jgi:uncharacterized protein YegP (UPF0339 family)
MSNKTKPFKLHSSKDKQFYTTTVSTNGNIVSTTETYTQKQNAKKSIMAQGRIWARIFGIPMLSTKQVMEYVEEIKK